MEHLRAWLTLDHSLGLPQAAVRAWLGQLGTAPAVLAASQHVLAHISGEAAARALKSPTPEIAQARALRVDAALAWLQADTANPPQRHILSWDNPLYPQQLLTIADPPMVLFVQGDVQVLQRPAVGIVGARNATQQGIANAKVFAQHVAQQGMVVVSGLALGIDAAAHEGALLADTPSACTVAVVGTGIDRVYPAAHRDLAHRIARCGAVVSEFAIGTPPVASNFPRRNRLISGLSRGVLVVEAAVRSGSLITARVAGEQGREVLAIPGSIHAPLSRGCHQLIKQGAKLVESGQDVLEELALGVNSGVNLGANLGLKSAPKSSAKISAKSGLLGSNLDSSLESSLGADLAASPPQRLLASMGHDPIDLDALMAATGLSASEALPALIELELAGQIEQLAGGRYQVLN